MNTCEESLRGELPPSLWNALITLILRPGKPRTKCESSHFSNNNGVKIIAKVLARRIEKHLPDIIALDQNGVIKGRLGSHNRLMNIIHAKKETSDMAVIGLDAEKAFGRAQVPM